jgi:hypothetical protein
MIYILQASKVPPDTEYCMWPVWRGLINSYLDYVASTFDVNPGLVHSEELDSLEVP